MIHSRGTKSHMLKCKLRTGTFEIMQLVSVHLDLPLFWKYHCATCVPCDFVLSRDIMWPDRAKNLFLIPYNLFLLLHPLPIPPLKLALNKKIKNHCKTFGYLTKPSATVQQYKPPQGQPHHWLPRGLLGPLTVYSPHGNSIIQLERDRLLLCYNLRGYNANHVFSSSEILQMFGLRQ